MFFYNVQKHEVYVVFHTCHNNHFHFKRPYGVNTFNHKGRKEPRVSVCWLVHCIQSLSLLVASIDHVSAMEVSMGLFSPSIVFLVLFQT